ncbi:hypothetical protein [Caloramator quimbayensis]|nr:hypothetical protein [Caloramator quimbayensis]
MPTVAYQSNKHQTVKNIAVVVGRKSNYNGKEKHGTSTKINIDLLKF